MIRANFISAKGAWQAKAADTIVLDYDERHRRRVTMKGVRGTEFLLDLPDAVHLRGGDALVLEDGRLIEIVAAPEKLAELRTPDARLMVRLAYHIGNRHAPAEILTKGLRIRRDHVLEEMAGKLGAKVMHIEAPFEPDGGAYEPLAEAPAKHAHGKHDHAKHDHGHHDHGHHDRGHKHDDHHDHDHGRKHDHGDHKHEPAHAHDHGHSDKHAHDHGHDHKAEHKHDHHGDHGHKHDHGHNH